MQLMFALYAFLGLGAFLLYRPLSASAQTCSGLSIRATSLGELAERNTERSMEPIGDDSNAAMAFSRRPLLC
jgi:hypothetical protein